MDLPLPSCFASALMTRPYCSFSERNRISSINTKLSAMLLVSDRSSPNPPFNFLEQDSLFYGLRNVGRCPDIHSHLVVLLTGPGRHDQYRRILGIGSTSEPLNDLKSIELRHLKIGDNERVLRGGSFSEPSSPSTAVST